MTSTRVISVNTGRGTDADWAGQLRRTAIDKRPVAGRTEVGRLGLGGDEQVDKPAHGGPEQALYAYSEEDLACWAAELGREEKDAVSHRARALAALRERLSDG